MSAPAILALEVSALASPCLGSQNTSMALLRDHLANRNRCHIARVQRTSEVQLLIEIQVRDNVRVSQRYPVCHLCFTMIRFHLPSLHNTWTSRAESESLGVMSRSGSTASIGSPYCINCVLLAGSAHLGQNGCGWTFHTITIPCRPREL